MNVWVVLGVRDGLADHIVEGVWSSHDAAVRSLAEREHAPGTTRCYLQHTVVDAPDAF